METSRNVANVSAQLLRTSAENLTAIAEELETVAAVPDPAMVALRAVHTIAAGADNTDDPYGDLLRIRSLAAKVLG